MGWDTFLWVLNVAKKLQGKCPIASKKNTFFFSLKAFWSLIMDGGKSCRKMMT